MGLGNTLPQETPHRISFFDTKKVIQIASGWEHCLALTEDRKVYSWGSNMNSQLGIEDIISQDIPQKIPFPKSHIAQILTGALHSIAITRNGDVYSWGENRQGELGLEYKKVRHTPTLVPDLKVC